MNQEALIPVMAGAVLVAAVALVMQALLLLAIYRTSKATKRQVGDIALQAESLIQSIQTTLESSRKQIGDATAKATQVLDLTKTQLVRIDAVLSDAAARAKVQLDRVELILDDTISRVHSTANAIHDGLLRPLKEVNGLAIGIGAALSYLFRGRRVSVEHATHDEEMFI